MSTIKKYFTKKLSKDGDKNSEGNFSTGDEFSRRGSATDETNEKRRLRSLSISRSGRFKQKKRDRGALQDRPDLYQGPCNPGEKCNAPGAACDKQENVASVHRQTTTHSNNSFLTRRASESDRLNLYTNQQRLELGNESSSVSSSRESLTTASRQTPLAGASTATSNKHSINNILRSGYTGSESSGRLTTGPTMV